MLTYLSGSAFALGQLSSKLKVKALGPAEANAHEQTGGDMRTHHVLLWLVAAAFLLIAVLLYRSCTSGNKLNVEPNAAEEIEKAKRR